MAAKRLPIRRVHLIAMAVIATSSATAATGGADSGEPVPIRFEATPCLVACSWWIDDLNTDLDGDGKADVHFDVCAAPVPVGYADVAVTAPPGAWFMKAHIDPVVDWEFYACSPTGEEIVRAETGPCTPAPGVPVGCRESFVVPIQGGRTVILRAVNFSDPFPATGEYVLIRIA